MEKRKKTIALVAHDNRKQDLKDWVLFNWYELIPHTMVCTGTTGLVVEEALEKKCEKYDEKAPEVIRLKSGPLGGDQQMGALIAEEKVDVMIFLWDPMEPQPHDVDVKALLRIASLYNIPTATNKATADFIISSPLFHEDYNPERKNYQDYLSRKIDINK
ncbi:methylglyoxal synthase [Balneicella halophila]|uniref:Methylglyoxal synthase n=1 Tax=Balneicella halophila TaxID=1537566 RepID=A0A7L4URX7_BALHA|nr:methylglyoxal synthase [Balneicella halophila]PVX51967.1 methylglyoxal synthase [Balneicella halophila]